MYKMYLPHEGKEIDIYTPDEGAQLIIDCALSSKLITKGAKKNRRYYYGCIMSFDIETTKLVNLNYDPKYHPESYHYFNITFCWQVCIDGKFIFGRKPEDFFNMLDAAATGLNGYVICYIHNIAYEFNNLRDFFYSGVADPENDLFFKSRSTPLYTRYRSAFEFRCSKNLTGKSLAAIGESIGYNKLKGDFDYSLQRDHNTVLTPEEVNYCYRDVMILYKYLSIERDNYCSINHKKVTHISHLPFTSTGYVRADMQKYFSRTGHGRYVLQHTELTADEYAEIAPALWGGFTHTNYRYVGIEVSNPLHVDITSAYPGAFLEPDGLPDKFTRARICSKETLLFNLSCKDRAVIAKLKMENVKLKKGGIPYIPAAKGEYNKDKTIIENGKILYAPELTIICCDVDIKLIMEAYDYDAMSPDYFYFGFKHKAPYSVVMLIEKYFNAKTTLKGVAGAEVEYDYSKRKINAIYGMSCQALLHAVYKLVNGTVRETGVKYESAKTLPYQWSIYITAYTRRLIYSMIQIMQRNNSFIYSDTDSIFFKYDPIAIAAIEDHNRRQREHLQELQKLHFNIIPKNPKGVPQYLFTLSYEDSRPVPDPEHPTTSDILTFCSIGAKRYYQEKAPGLYDVTFSGLRATKITKDKDGKKINGYNTQRLIDIYGSLHAAFEQIKSAWVDLPYIEGVDKMSNYNMTGDFRGELNGIEYRRPCTYTLYPQSTTLSLNYDLKKFLISEVRHDYD